MKIGNYNVVSVETGRFALDGGAMFGVVPKTLWNRTNPADEKNRIDLALRSLLLFNKDKVILVDTGIGQKWAEKHKDIYKIDFKKYNIENSLKKFGFTKEDVTDVILTHLHFDHTGGSTFVDENGETQLSFPNATHFINKRNWEHALSPTDRDKASFVKEDFYPIFEKGKLKIIEEITGVFENIEFVISDGHTIGMQLVKVSDKENTLIYCADLIPTSSHIPVPFVMGYDIQPLITVEEKKKVLAQAVREDWILFFEHDPIGEACKVKLENGKFSAGERISLN
ncbi:MAG: MBL fold metallo-hydrolase [Calditrichaeota bacterium]|nr:MAG: MBL fold metallo-hydrolase [Calditrichota bacterium]